MPFVEINLEIYNTLSEYTTNVLDSAAPGKIRFELGGNTWNIIRTLSRLGRNVRFACTSSREDMSISILETSHYELTPSVVFVPSVSTPAPRFVAVDGASGPLLRTIDIPNQSKPTVEQLGFVSRLITESYNAGYTIAVLASSIEDQLMKHIITECSDHGLTVVAAASSAPTVSRFVPYLSALDLVVLNQSEAQVLAEFLDFPTSGTLQTVRLISRQGPEVIITGGEKELWARSSNGKEYAGIPPHLGESFVNDLGAGDTFLAFLIDSFLRQGRLVCREGLAWAMTGGCLACQTQKHILEEIDSSTANNLYTHLLEGVSASIQQ